MNATATKITAKNIHLARVANGYYAYNAPNFTSTYDVIKQGAGVWTITARRAHSEPSTWIVDSLNAARTFIASDI